MRQLNISIGVITQGNAYLLQQRGIDPQIGAAGKIGAFGGKIEPDETPEQAICRELAEETSLRPTLDQINHAETYTITSDHKLEEVYVNVSAFEITIEEHEDIVATDGDIVKILKAEVSSRLKEMTPATRYYFERVKGE